MNHSPLIEAMVVQHALTVGGATSWRIDWTVAVTPGCRRLHALRLAHPWVVADRVPCSETDALWLSI